jgi:hypothetical protein
MVGCWYSKNSFFTKRSTHELLPTAASPSRTSLAEMVGVVISPFYHLPATLAAIMAAPRNQLA